MRIARLQTITQAQSRGPRHPAAATHTLAAALALLLALATAACSPGGDDDDDDAAGQAATTETTVESTADEPAPPPVRDLIVGDWVDDNGLLMSVDDSRVATHSSFEGNGVTFMLMESFTVALVDDANSWVVVRHDATSPIDAGTYTRFDLTVFDGRTHYCRAVMGSFTVQGATGAPFSDKADKDAGCRGGSPWTGLTASRIEVAGEHVDDFGGAHSVTALRWVSGDSVFNFFVVDNEANLAIAQNGSENSFNPNLFSKFEWDLTEGVLRYCQSSYDAVSLPAAIAAPAADRADFAKGCGGFSWSILTPAP